MERIAARERQPPALDAAVVEILDDAIAHRRIERLAAVEPPGALVVATRALVLATRHEQGGAGTGAVYDIDRIVLVVMHRLFPASFIGVQTVAIP
ncbi:hypothetical protein D3C75_1043500 [compost metagenome]